MSIDQLNVVDTISTDSGGNVVLTVSDHLDWSDSVQHQIALQAKFNKYLAFVESGELLERYPDAKSRAVVFKVVFKFAPDSEGVAFLTRAQAVIESAGFKLRHEVFSKSYAN
jgi:hypothetical protein